VSVHCTCSVVEAVVRFVEAFCLAKVFVSSEHMRIGYLSKDTLAQWEKDKLINAAAG
jgi:hypothetical protein